MKTRHPHDGLIEAVRHEPWYSRFEDVMAEHVGAVCDYFAITSDDITAFLSLHWFQCVWSAVLEDLMARVSTEGDNNLIADYLKRRGWKESGRNRIYLRAAQRARMSLYNVHAVDPGRGITLIDRLHGGDAIVVRERSASRTLQAGTPIAVRLIRCPDRTIIAGALFPFDPNDAAMFEEVHQALRANRIADAKAAAGWRADVLDPNALARVTADPTAIDPLVTAFWLAGAVQGVLDAEPLELANTDGDPLSFVSLHYDLASGVTSTDLSDAFAAHPGLHVSDEQHWSLQDPGDETCTVLAFLKLSDDTLVVETNSQARSERARTVVEEAADGLLTRPRREVADVRETLAAHAARTDPARMPDSETPSTAAAEKAVHQVLDERYKQTLDEPVPMLDGLTPRQAAQSPDTRDRVIDWLEDLEAMSRKEAGSSPMATYDFSWIWKTLGLKRRGR